MSLSPRLRTRIGGLYFLLIALNAGVWGWAILAFHRYPVLLGSALLAYAFGLRHAVDADHIAAIDNVTRKLMQQGQRPLGAGLYFSLGHSTIVFALSLALALTSVAVKGHLAILSAIGGVVGTGISAAFLLTIAGANLVVLGSVFRTFQAVKRGGRYAEEDLALLLAKRGCLGRIFRSVFQLIEKSWQMYFVGFLFGLGFDTATEIGLLGLSAKSAATGLPIWSILIFPALFTAGMALLDTTDGVVMVGAYRWALLNPLRKLYYNLTVTSISVLVAILIGGIEALGLIGHQLNLQGRLWSAVSAVSSHLGLLGFAIVGVFIASWAASIAVYRFNRYDRVARVTWGKPSKPGSGPADSDPERESLAQT